MKIKVYKIILAGLMLLVYGCGPKYVSPVPKANEYFKQGMEYYDAEEYNRAMTKFIQALSEDPGHKTAKEYRDKSQDRLREQIRAEQAARKERLRRQRENQELVKQLRKDLEEAYEQEEWIRAEAAASEILEYYPNDEEVQLYLEEVQDNIEKRNMEQEVDGILKEAEALRGQGNFEEALSKVEEVLTHFPANQEARELETSLKQEIERKKAEANRQELFDEQRAENMYERALNFMESEDYVETILLLEDVNKLIPGYKQSEQFLQKSKEKLQEQTENAVVDSLLHRAVESEYKEAIEKYLEREFRAALREFENIADYVRLDRAIRYHDLLKERLERMEDRDQAENYYLDARQEYMDENMREANKKLNEALDLYPNFPEARYYKKEVENILDKESRVGEFLSAAQDEFNKNNYADALTHAIKVFEVDKNNTRAKDMVKKCAAKLAGTQNVEDSELDNFEQSADKAYSNENYKEAVQNWAKMLLIEPNDKSAVEDIKHTTNVIAEIRRQERLEAQRRNQREAARQKRQRIDNYLDQAAELQKQGKHQKAIEVWEKVLSEEPEHQEAKQGIETSKAALEEEIPDGVDEKRIEEMYREGLILYSEGRYNDAISQWQRVLNLAPEHERAKQNIKSAREKLEN
ncbi:MAG: hypothetical protein ACQEQC_05420 [Elusimicrobiota bacterium]